MKKVITWLKTSIFKVYIKFKEQKYNGRLKYLFFNKNSTDLVVVFSAFPSDNRPRYNYIKSLTSLQTKDRLYILDDFGYKGSYYWYDHGENFPMVLVEGLILDILSRNNYNHIYTVGTSKGGTCAIYYGLQFNATAVFSGANQYYIGKYLNVPERKDIFNAMINICEDESVWTERLNNVMRNQLSKFHDSNCIVNLLYSKDEHTYKDDIEGMIEDMKQFGIKYSEKIESFNDHGKVGNYFIPWINGLFLENT